MLLRYRLANIMKLSVHHDNIYKFSDFLSFDELKSLRDMVDGFPADQQSWTRSDSPPFWFGKVYVYGNNEPLTSIEKKLESLFDTCDETIFNSIVDFQRTLPTDDPMEMHRDVIGHSDLKYGLVLYLNDDYTGGEISYPEYNLDIKPTAGMVVIHSGDVLHGVLPILGGSPRYIITNFVRCPHDDGQCKLKVKTI
jgi:hypothetical protein